MKQLEQDSMLLHFPCIFSHAILYATNFRNVWFAY